MTKLIGIINLTPDSFSDGGRFSSADDVLSYAEKALEEGAHVLDVGAESTRPGAIAVSPEEEWRRLSPVLPDLVTLARHTEAEISVDTRHAKTADRALEAGVHWINDVSGASSDALLMAVAAAKARYVLMHSLSVPADPRKVMGEEDIVRALLLFAEEKLEALAFRGIARSQIIFDPGIGFGKTSRQSHELIRRISEFKSLGVPLLVGHSRKSFLGLANASLEKKDHASAAITKKLAQKGVEYIRVHNLSMHQEAILSPEIQNA